MEELKIPMEVAQGIYLIKLPTPFPVGPVNVYLIEGDYLTANSADSPSC